jgi:exodeoxyribonuclease VIII
MKVTIETLKERPLSFSSVKQFIKSPQHYIQYLTQERKQTDSMLLGSVVHNLILQPETFDDKYIVEPDFNKRTNQGKEDYQKFLELIAQRKLQAVPPNIFLKAKEMVTQFMNSPNYKHVQVMDGKEIRFDKDYDSLPVCGYIDGMNSEYNFEVKTVSSAEYSDIQRDFYNLKYHLQAAIYNWVNGKNIMYIVIETSHPYLSRVFIPSDTYIEEGKKLFSKAMTDFAYCLDMDLFDSGYEFYGGSDPMTLDLPGWAKKSASDDE